MDSALGRQAIEPRLNPTTTSTQCTHPSRCWLIQSQSWRQRWTAGQCTTGHKCTMVWARSLTNQRKLKDSIGCIQCEQPITDTWTFNHKANEFKWNIELLFQSNKPASPHPVGSPSRKPVTRTNGANGKWQHIIHHVTAKTTLSTTADTWLELNIAYFTDTSSQKQQFTCWHQSTQVTICNMLFFWFALPPPPPPN